MIDPIKPGESTTLIVSEEDIDNRIDVFIAKNLNLYSRSFFQKLIDENYVLKNNKAITKHKTKVQLNDIIKITFPPEKIIEPKKIIDQKLDVKIIYEHQDFFIISKPACLIVHDPTDSPLKNNIITLVDWLLAHFKGLEKVGLSQRPGIVHRLDMNTSGILIIPRKNYSHTIFGNMFRNREIKKTYLAIVQGHPDKSGTIDLPISRHKQQKIKMTHTDPNGRQSLTHYKIIEYFDDCSLVEAKPVTGRTHQIRVHLSAIGHPIIGDIVYGKKSKIINRQALHAQKIEFEYQKEPFSFSCPAPKDFQDALEKLKNKI